MLELGLVLLRAAVLVVGIGALLLTFCALGTRFQEPHVRVAVDATGRATFGLDGLWLAALSPWKRLSWVPVVGLQPPKTGVPNISITAKNVAADPELLVALMNVMEKHGVPAAEGAGKAASSSKLHMPSSLPLLYFDVVTFRMILLLLAHGQFPWVLLGSVKTKVAVEQVAEPQVNARFDLAVRPLAQRPHRRGTEVDIEAVVTQAADGDTPGTLVWRCVTTNLFFHRQPNPPPKPPADTICAPGTGTPRASATVHLPWNLGRLYAAVCGDYNPIHMYRWSANLFGFPRPMAHGVCVADLAIPRAYALCDEALVQAVQSGEAPRAVLKWPISARHLHIAFKKPSFLGNDMEFTFWVEHDRQPDAYCTTVRVGTRLVSSKSRADAHRRWCVLATLTLRRSNPVTATTSSSS